MTVLLKSSVKLLRNLKGINFMPKLNDVDALDVIKILEPKILDLAYENKDVLKFQALEKLQYIERGILKAPFMESNISSYYVRKDSPDILLNESNHLVIRKSSRDEKMEDMFDEVLEIEESLDKDVAFAFDSEFGYLTTRPINAGTGLLINYKLHLPALNFYGIENVSRSLLRLGYSLDSYKDKSGKTLANIFNLFFESTIGYSEEAYIKKMKTIVKEIIVMEKEAEKKLYLDSIITLEDMVNRSLGILRNARILSEDEMFNCMSNIDLGLNLSILKAKRDFDFYDEANKLKNGYLQNERGSILDLKSRDILRANKSRALIREVF